MYNDFVLVPPSAATIAAISVLLVMKVSLFAAAAQIQVPWLVMLPFSIHKQWRMNPLMKLVLVATMMKKRLLKVLSMVSLFVILPVEQLLLLPYCHPFQRPNSHLNITHLYIIVR